MDVWSTDYGMRDHEYSPSPPRRAPNKTCYPPPTHTHTPFVPTFQNAVQDVEDVVDAAFVEELEKASITKPMENRGKGKATTRSASAAGRVTNKEIVIEFVT